MANTCLPSSLKDRMRSEEKVVLPTRAKEGIRVSLKQVYKSIYDLIEITGLKKKNLIEYQFYNPQKFYKEEQNILLPDLR